MGLTAKSHLQSETILSGSHKLAAEQLEAVNYNKQHLELTKLLWVHFPTLYWP